MALLGIAPFTPPNPFMIAVLLAVMQVRVAHVWLTRMLRAQVRRHVTELEAEVVESEAVPDSQQPVLLTKLRICCDGGLVRNLHLGKPKENETRATVKDIFEKGQSFVFLDQKLGSVTDKQVLELILNSSLVVSHEELKVIAVDDESQEDTEKLVQKFTDLTTAYLKGTSQSENSVFVQLEDMSRWAKASSLFFLSGGALLCIMGRRQAELKAGAFTDTAPQHV